MGLRSALADIAALAADDIRGNPLLKRARREHDEWARTAQLGPTYYTIKPTSGDAIHSAYVFDRRANWGVYTGQLMASQTPSWTLWFQHGPLTLDARWTHADQRRRDEEISAAFESGLADRVTERWLREELAQYPATLQFLAA